MNAGRIDRLEKQLAPAEPMDDIEITIVHYTTVLDDESGERRQVLLQASGYDEVESCFGVKIRRPKYEHEPAS